MTTIVFANLFIFITVSAIAIFIGLDLKKWSSWLFGIYGFISGFLLGFLRADTSGSLKLGLLMAFVVMYGGATSHWHRQRFKQ